jgi:hypothetical protein
MDSHYQLVHSRSRPFATRRRAWIRSRLIGGDQHALAGWTWFVLTVNLRKSSSL